MSDDFRIISGRHSRGRGHDSRFADQVRTAVGRLANVAVLGGTVVNSPTGLVLEPEETLRAEFVRLSSGEPNEDGLYPAWRVRPITGSFPFEWQDVEEVWLMMMSADPEAPPPRLPAVPEGHPFRRFQAWHLGSVRPVAGDTADRRALYAFDPASFSVIITASGGEPDDDDHYDGNVQVDPLTSYPCKWYFSSGRTPTLPAPPGGPPEMGAWTHALYRFVGFLRGTVEVPGEGEDPPTYPPLFEVVDQLACLRIEGGQFLDSPLGLTVANENGLLFELDTGTAGFGRLSMAVFTGPGIGVDGTAGAVPAPTAAMVAAKKVLRSDGVWADPLTVGAPTGGGTPSGNKRTITLPDGSTFDVCVP